MKRYIILAVIIAALIAGYWFLHHTGGPGSAGGGNSAVIVTEARMAAMSDSIEALGTTLSNDSIQVTSNVSEAVTRVNFTDGMPVKAGDIIVELDHGEEQADVEEAEADLVQQQQEYNRVVPLVKSKTATQSRLDEQSAKLKSAEARLASAKARLADRIIVAPFDGVLGLRMVSVGTLVQPGTLITNLDDSTKLKVDFTVPETYIAALKQGMGIAAHSPAYPGAEFKGTVVAVDSRVDPATRMITMRAEVPNPDGRLRPGMLLTINLSTPEEQKVVIPEESLVPMQDRQFVYVIDKDNKAQKVEVTTGRRKPGVVEIVSGLKPGDKVVTEGMMTLRPGAEVVIQQPPKTAEAPPAS